MNNSFRNFALYEKKKRKKFIIREFQLLDLGIYFGDWSGTRSNSYRSLNILLHISMEDFWFQLAFYSLLLDAGCQTSNLLICTIPRFFFFLIHAIRKAEVPIAICGGLRVIRLDCDFNSV